MIWLKKSCDSQDAMDVCQSGISRSIFLVRAGGKKTWGQKPPENSHVESKMEDLVQMIIRFLEVGECFGEPCEFSGV